MGAKPRWCVHYKAKGDGHQVEIFFSGKKEAERFAEMVRKVNPGTEPQVEEK